MSRRGFVNGTLVMIWTALLALVGCRKPAPAAAPPRAWSVAGLKFPAVVIHDRTAALVHQNAEELQKLHVNYVNGMRSAPTLIDSNFNVLAMENLRSTKGGLWLMANPSGTTPITFDLKAQSPGGLEAARGLLVGCRYLGGGAEGDEAKRKRLATCASLAEMIQVLDGR